MLHDIGIRYLLSSAGTWGVDLLVFLLTYRVMPVPLALLVSRLAATAFGFWAHRLFSFRRSGCPSPREVLGYTALATLNFAIIAAALSVVASADEVFISAIKLSLELALFALNYFVLQRLFIGRAAQARRASVP